MIQDRGSGRSRAPVSHDPAGTPLWSQHPDLPEKPPQLPFTQPWFDSWSRTGSLLSEGGQDSGNHFSLRLELEKGEMAFTKTRVGTFNSHHHTVKRSHVRSLLAPVPSEPGFELPRTHLLPMEHPLK